MRARGVRACVQPSLLLVKTLLSSLTLSITLDTCWVDRIPDTPFQGCTDMPRPLYLLVFSVTEVKVYMRIGTAFRPIST